MESYHTHELYQAQLDLEVECVARGINRFKTQYEKGRGTGQHANYGIERSYVMCHILPGVEAHRLYGYKGETLHDRYAERLDDTRPGRRAKGWELLRGENCKPEDLVSLALPVAISHAHEGKTRTSLTTSLTCRLVDELNHVMFQTEYGDGLRKALLKRSKMPTPQDTRFRFKNETAAVGYTWWSPEKEEREAMGQALAFELLEVCTDAIQEYQERRGRKTTAFLQLTPEFHMNSKALLKELAERRPEKSPCIIPPLPWTTPWNGGYHGVLRGSVKAIHSGLQGSQQAIARHWDTESEHVRALNKLQQQGYRINPKVHAVFDWVVREAPHKDMWGLKLFELQEKPWNPMGMKRTVSSTEWKKIWHNYQKECHSFIEDHEKNNAHTHAITRIHTAAKTLAQYPEIYLIYYLDWRGRMYVEDETGLTPQGQDLAKGLYEFSEPRRVGKRGIYWLKVHAANCFGNDKVTLDERVAWADENMERIITSAEEPRDCMWWLEADEPWQFLSVCYELLGVSQEGENWESRCIVHQDGCCNGPAHMALMSRCKHTASKVSLTADTERPYDLYAEVAQYCRDAVEQDVAESTVEPEEILDQVYIMSKRCDEYQSHTKEARELRKEINVLLRDVIPYILENNLDYIDRDLVKRPVMTYTYSVTPSGARQQIVGIMNERAEKDKKNGSKRSEDLIPRKEWYLKHAIAGYLTEKIFECLSVTLKATADTMKYLQNCGELLANQGLACQWTSPSGHWINHSCPKQEMFRATYRTNCQRYFVNLRRDVTMTLPNGQEVSAQVTRDVRNGIAPNFTHSMDAAHLAMFVNRFEQPMCTIHDSFGCHPSNVDEMRNVLRETLRDLYADDQLLKFRNECRRILEMGVVEEAECMALIAQLESFPMPHANTFDINEILDATYAFC